MELLPPAATDSTLGTPIGLRFDTEGRLYVANARGRSVDRYDADSGRLIDRFAAEIPFASDVAFDAAGDFHVSAASASAVLRFDRVTGTLVDTTVVLPDGGAPVGLAFLPDGRLRSADRKRSIHPLGDRSYTPRIERRIGHRVVLAADR